MMSEHCEGRRAKGRELKSQKYVPKSQEKHDTYLSIILQPVVYI
jgi:hypothetical protein